LRQLRNHRTVLHVADELPGHYQAPLGMLPAQQRLGTYPLPRRHFDDGLIDDKELITRQAPPDAADQAPPRPIDAQVASRDRRTQQQANQ
jgi:hypothetical protein